MGIEMTKHSYKEPAHILAKGPPENITLLEHTIDCLQVFRQLKQCLPALSSCSGDPRFWDLLFVAVYMHDWGKACSGFQKQLRPNGSRWGERHERVSAAFAQLLDMDTTNIHKIARAILGHHKSFDRLRELHIRESVQNDPDSNLSYVYGKAMFMQRIGEVSRPYIRFMKNLFPEIAKRFHPENRIGMRKGRLRDLQDPYQDLIDSWLKSPPQSKQRDYWTELLLGGALRLCDHLGSARIKTIYTISTHHFRFLEKISPYPHQRATWNARGHVLLTAPTGSGKTEAALGWIRSQLTVQQGRVFYILPYTASINAMHVRLAKLFTPDRLPHRSHLVGLLHGKVRQHLLSAFEDHSVYSELHVRELVQVLRKMVHPLKIVTPFQLLKHAFGVRGYEIGLTELAGAILVFDEIHAYDAETFARIVSLLKWLTRYMQIRVMIMTATLPYFLKRRIQTILENPQDIHAPSDFIHRLRRHRLHICEGSLQDQYSSIRDTLVKQNKRVMVVCNTISEAQRVFQDLSGLAPKKQSVLLHGRFTYADRYRKEQRLIHDSVRLLVGTQTVEVSLDIDFDVLYTQPAPLDALVQRFGRINRHHPERKGLCDLYVSEKGGNFDHLIYNPQLVAKSLNVMEPGPIDEIKLQSWLDNVYPDWPESMEQRYQQTLAAFDDHLNHLYPYRDHKRTEEEFEALFDGIPVLPVSLKEKYDTLLQKGRYIESETLLVPISSWKFAQLSSMQRLIPHQIDLGKKLSHKVYIVACDYDSDLGLLDSSNNVYLQTEQFL